MPIQMIGYNYHKIQGSSYWSLSTIGFQQGMFQGQGSPCDEKYILLTSLDSQKWAENIMKKFMAEYVSIQCDCPALSAGGNTLYVKYVWYALDSFLKQLKWYDRK